MPVPYWPGGKPPPGASSRARSGIRYVGGQYVYDPLPLPPLSKRLSSRIFDPLGPMTTDDRSEYQTRYNQMLREQEIDLVDSLIEQGAQFDEETMAELGKSRPGEILEKASGGRGVISSKYTPEQQVKLQELLGDDYRNAELQSQVEALGGNVPDQGGPSGLARVFDVLSRGQYASAEAVQSGLEEGAEQGPRGNPFETLGAFAKGFGRGLTGHDKTSYHDVLKENLHMKEGKPTGVLGFALDVGLDPTTYLTAGTATAARQGAKAGSKTLGRELTEEGVEQLVKEGAEKTMARTLTEAAGSEAMLGGRGSRVARRTIREEAEAAGRQAAREELEAAGRRVTKKKLDDAGKAAGKQALRDAEDAAAKRAADTAVEARRVTEALESTKQVELRFLGKKIAASEKLYRPIRGISEGAKGTRVGGALNRAFRTDAEMSKRIHFLDRLFKNASSAQYEDELKQIQNAFAGSKADRVAVTHAIEEGSTKAISGSPRQMEMYDEAKRWFKRIADSEVDAGALKPEDLVDNYVYHAYKRTPRQVVGEAVPSKKGKFKTIREAQARGAQPVDDIADILAHRLAKSHKVTSRYNFHQAISDQFGIRIGSGTIKDKALRRMSDSGVISSGKKVSSIMPEGVYFDAEVASTLQKLDKFYTSEESIKGFLRQFDRVQAKFKFLMTAPNPGFHMRNMMGDMFANMLDGVVDPRMYDFAAKMMQSTLEPGNPLYRNFKGSLRVGQHSVSADEFRQLYEGMGLKSGFFHSDTGLIPTPGRRVLSRASSAVRTASEFREDWMRMTHFIDAMRKEASTKAGAKESLATLAEKASMRVKKFNFDYQDLTRLEQKGFRRAVPFYTFMRKNIPLQLEMLATRPGRVAVLPKGLRAMQEIMGEDSSNDVFPGLPDVIPEWIREMPGFQMQAASMEGPGIFVNPDFPINQLQDYLGGFVGSEGQFTPGAGLRRAGQELIGGTTPVASIPIEYLWQQDLQSGAPIEASFTETILNQIPAYGTYSAATSPDEGQSEQMVEVGGQRIPERLLNYLTGAGVRVNTPQRQKSQLKREEDILRAIIKKLEEEQGMAEL